MNGLYLAIKEKKEMRDLQNENIEDAKRRRDWYEQKGPRSKPLERKRDEEEQTAMEYLKYRRKPIYPLPDEYRREMKRIRRMHRRRGWSPIVESRYNPSRRLTPVIVPNYDVPIDHGYPRSLLKKYDAIPNLYTQDINVKLDSFPPGYNYPRLSQRFAKPTVGGVPSYYHYY